jgi:hypothetical protein
MRILPSAHTLPFDHYFSFECAVLQCPAARELADLGEKCIKGAEICTVPGSFARVSISGRFRPLTPSWL